jgi:hypothetical protein
MKSPRAVDGHSHVGVARSLDVIAHYRAVASPCVAALAPAMAVMLAAAIVIAPLLGAPTLAQEARDGDPVQIGTFRQLHSSILGEDRLLLISLPPAYETTSLSYPVLFVLYGDQIRGYFAEAVHVVDRLSDEGSIPPMIVVGVANTDRYRDLSPVARQGAPSGIEPFSRFFVEELVPFIEARYRTKDFRVLVGPQAGAEFGLYALATRPGLLDACIIENPFRSQSVHDALMPMMEERMEDGFPSFTFLQMTCADQAGQLDKTAEMEYARQFAKLIADRRPQNLTLITHYVEKSEDWLPPLRLKEGLRELFRDYQFPGDREVRGLADIATYYAGLSERYGFEVDIPEHTLAVYANALKQAGEIDPAREIFEHMIRLNPSSLDGHWGLANLHRESGNREAAIEHYRKCLEILPTMAPARDWLERLEGEK